MLQKIIACVTLITLFGCSTTGSIMARNIVPPFFDRLPGARELYSPQIIIGYPGEIRKPEEVAVISNMGSLYIESIDFRTDFTQRIYPKKKYIMDYEGAQFHLLPGTYVINFCFKYSNPDHSASCMKTIQKTMKLNAGQKIVLYMEFPTANTWTIKERLMKPEELASLNLNFKKHVLDPK